MIQDIQPHILDNHYEPGYTPTETSPVVCFLEDGVLLKQTDAGSELPRYRDFPEGTKVLYLFHYDREPVFLKVSGFSSETPLPEGCKAASIKTIRAMNLLEKHQVFLLMTATQLANWYKDNRYCGRCGGHTVHSPRERALLCPTCNRTIYPRILPAVIVAVLHEGRILLTKYAPRSGQSYPYYALVAGFTEIGETFEECVAREVAEETGLKVKNIRYYKSQPWGIVDDLLAGFFCECDGDPTIHLDKNELKTAVWLTPEEVELQPDVYSLTNEMMLLFKAGKISSPSELPLPLTRADIEKLEEQYYSVSG